MHPQTLSHALPNFPSQYSQHSLLCQNPSSLVVYRLSLSPPSRLFNFSLRNIEIRAFCLVLCSTTSNAGKIAVLTFSSFSDLSWFPHFSPISPDSAHFLPRIVPCGRRAGKSPSFIQLATFTPALSTNK